MSYKASTASYTTVFQNLIKPYKTKFKHLKNNRTQKPNSLKLILFLCVINNKQHINKAYFFFIGISIALYQSNKSIKV